MSIRNTDTAYSRLFYILKGDVIDLLSPLSTCILSPLPLPSSFLPLSVGQLLLFPLQINASHIRISLSFLLCLFLC